MAGAVLTDVDEFASTVTVPTAGDPVAAGPGSYLRTALQTLANRTRYLYNVLNNGIRKIRYVESYTALKALTGMTKGTVALVYSGNFPHLFFFQLSDTPPSEISGMVYPDDGETGFWMSDLYFLDGIDFNFGSLTLSGTFIGKGRFRRRTFTMTDADATVSVTNYDLVFIPIGVLSTNRALTIQNTGAVEGDVIRVVSADTVNYVTVGAGAYSLPVQLASGQVEWIEFTFISGAWKRTARYVYP